MKKSLFYAVMLKICDARKEYGGLIAVDNVSFEINRNEIVGLIGPNGAGKTTLFNIITGIHNPDGHSSIEFKGRDIVSLGTHDIVHAGITRTFQLVRVFDGMTVLENTLAGALFGSLDVVSRESAKAEAMDILEFLDLDEKADRRAAELTIAQQKQLELARALASDPDLILIDEIASGLTPPEIDEISGIIARIRDERQISVFWVEHVIDAIMNTVDRIIVLNSGTVIASGQPEEIRQNQRVIDAYLGSQA